MPVITKQELIDAAADAKTIEDVANGSATINGTGIVISRLGTPIKTAAKVIQDAGGAFTPGDNTITSAKIAANAVTEPKHATGGVSTRALADLATTTAKLANNAVTIAKLDGVLQALMPTLSKADPLSVAFLKTGAFTVSIKAGTSIKVGALAFLFASNTAITMPVSPTVGQDYGIWMQPNGDIVATNSLVTPSVINAILIGGFHYAAGSNATGYNTGGNLTPSINEYSIWDIKFRPKCSDPRGMALIGGMFWADIYLLGIDHHLNGTSRYNVAVATGTTKPKIPAMFGGDGSLLVTQMDWLWTAEIYDSFQKRFMNYKEFKTAAFGVVEEISREVAPVTTGYNTTNNSGASNKDNAYTSMFGLNHATGAHYVWGTEIVYGQYPGSYTGATIPNGPDITPGLYAAYNGRARGKSQIELATALRGMLYGGKLAFGLGSGSGSADMANAVQTFSQSISARGAADHLILS